VYQEGRDAFRSSVPHLRKDSVDAPSLAETNDDGEEGDETILESLPPIVDGSTRRGMGWQSLSPRGGGL
jgi:hypothetical protein